MRSGQPKSLCPSRYCAGYNPIQTLVSKRQAELVDETAIADAILCSGCGCVWVRDHAGKGRILGTLRKVGSRYEWKSNYPRPAGASQT